MSTLCLVFFVALAAVTGCSRTAPALASAGSDASSVASSPAESPLSSRALAEEPGRGGVHQSPREPVTPDTLARARVLAKKLLLIDGHIDFPERVIAARTRGAPDPDPTAERSDTNFDYVRAKRGGLDAPFMSIYTPAAYEGKGAKAFAENLIDIVTGLAQRAPAQVALASTPDDVEANFAAGRISLPMGMENGAPLEGELDNIAYFHSRGIRYITLAHSEDNHISDASYANTRTNGGLSPFGRRVVQEMNRVGIMIDVSHISDEAFRQVLDLTAVPVIASHSSCRHFTPGWERNMDDGMLERLRDNGGVIQIAFASPFVSNKSRLAFDDGRRAIATKIETAGLAPGSAAARAVDKAYWESHPPALADVADVADHIDHVVSLIGIDHVGLGSDFDGVGDTLPTNLKDVADYPNLIAELLSRGYGSDELRKLAGTNVLRVWRAAEDHARLVASPNRGRQG